MAETIVLGGGCFWCTEAVYNRVEGVIKVTSGYAGGHTKDPTYEEVCTGETGHAEVVKVDYDPEKVSLLELLETFFRTHDPTQLNRQGNDIGTQYRSIILYTNETQKKLIEKYIEELSQDMPIVTQVKKLDEFYPAEKYHEQYYERNKTNPYCMFVIRPKLEKMKK